MKFALCSVTYISCCGVVDSYSSVTCIEFRNIGNRNRKKTARYEVTNEDKSEPSKCTVEDTSAALDSSSSEEEEYKSLLTSIEKI